MSDYIDLNDINDIDEILEIKKQKEEEGETGEKKPDKTKSEGAGGVTEAKWLYAFPISPGVWKSNFQDKIYYEVKI